MPTSLFLPSGNMLADRRFGFARDLQARGDLEAAADLLLQATELAPGFATAWFALADIRERRGDVAGAVAAFRNAAHADPDDRHGAGLRLMRLGAEEVAAMPAGYVRTLFDQYAPTFEASLVGDLGYRGPDILFRTLRAVCAAAGRPFAFRRAIDLGCGTGLAGRAFAGQADELIGIDIAPQMIARAAATGLYAQLAVADMVEGLREQPAASADLILAADAVVYVSDLAPMLGEAHRVMTPDGLLAFTAETHDGEGDSDGVILGRGLRYAHASAYVRRAIVAAGLTLLRLDLGSARTEGGVPVPGLAVVAAKR